jgi:hypothetical protein
MSNVVSIKPGQAIARPKIPWAEAVKRGRECVARASDIQWELGELANNIEPKYGEETLERLAAELDVNPGTLKNYRTVFRAFPGKEPRGSNSFKVCDVFTSQEDRLKLVARRKWTVAEATKYVKKRREKQLEKEESEREPDEPEDEEDTPETKWQRSLSNHAGDAIAMISLWKKLFGDWRKFKVPSDLVTLATRAAEEWNELAGDLAERENPNE